MTNSIKSLETQYNTIDKCLLGVRSNTSMKLCMLEAGIPPLSSIIRRNRQSFLARQFAQPNDEHPFHQVHAVCAAANTPAARFIRAALEHHPEPPLEGVARMVRENVNATRLSNYCNRLNPELSVSPVYTTEIYIPDNQRTSFTRLRVMSHRLKVETGR